MFGGIQRTNPVLACVLLLLTGGTLPGQEDVRDKVSREYVPALEKLESEFAPLHGTARVRMRLTNGNIVNKTINFWLNPGAKKIQVLTEDPEGPIRETIYCSTPDLAFVLDKKDDAYVVRELASDRAGVDREIGLQIGFALFPSWRINPFSFVPIDGPLASIAEAIQTGAYRLASARSSMANEQEFVDIKYDYTIKRDSKTMAASDRLRVSPGEGWALHRMETDVRDSTTGTWREGITSIDIHYRPDSHPMRMPDVVEVKRSAMELDRYELETIRFETTPDREFTTSYYGLPDLRATSGRGQRMGTASWLLIVGAICLLLGIALRQYGDRLGRAIDRFRTAT